LTLKYVYAVYLFYNRSEPNWIFSFIDSNLLGIVAIVPNFYLLINSYLSEANWSSKLEKSCQAV